MTPHSSDPTRRALLQGFPIATITSPGQSGETTLAKLVFSEKPYLALDDPRSFLDHFPNDEVLDKVQRASKRRSNLPPTRYAAVFLKLLSFPSS